MTIIEIRTILKKVYNDLPIDCRPTALIDLPLYFNIGDSLIGLGQFKLLGVRPKYSYIGSIPNDKVLENIEKTKGVILLCGGGNFGTLWPFHQRLRERVVEKCPSATIIQLPQSIYFDDQGELDQSLKILESHKDFHLLVRDQKSYNMVSNYNLTSVTLTPDSAFILKAQALTKPKYDILFLARKDHEVESINRIKDLEKSFHSHNNISADWATCTNLKNLFNKQDNLSNYLIPKIINVFRTPSSSKLLWEALFKSRLELGVRLLSSARVIITDRLHVHILCSLIGKPHIFYDNNYCKIGNFSNTWTTQSNIFVSAKDSQNVHQEVEDLLSLTNWQKQKDPFKKSD